MFKLTEPPTNGVASIPCSRVPEPLRAPRYGRRFLAATCPAALVSKSRCLAVCAATIRKVLRGAHVRPMKSSQPASGCNADRMDDRGEQQMYSVLNLPRSRRRPSDRAKFWLPCLAVTSLLLLVYATGYSIVLQKSPPVSNPDLNTPKTLRAAALPAMPDAPTPEDMYRFALNALLLPLMDDAEPPRWTDVAIDLSCGPATRVTVDGESLPVGMPIPASAFKLRLDMDHCAPLGAGYAVLSGSVELLVFHEDDGLSAMVVPESLRAETPFGRAWLQGPFAATTSLGTTVDVLQSKLSLR